MTDARPATLRFMAALIIVTTVEAAALGWILTRLGLSHPAAAIVLTIMVMLYIAAIAAAAFRYLWNPVLAPYPAREPAPGAVRRSFQSFGLGIVNMSGSVHVAVDDECLHLTPLTVWRLCGARAASIPWSALVPAERSPRVALIGGPQGCRLEGPAWCIGLVNPAERGG